MLFFKISIFSLITIIAMVISLLCVHCHSHSFARTWTEKKICRSKDLWLDFVTMITCIWVESSLGELVGQSVVQPSRGVRVGYCSSNCCFIWKCWQCSYSDHVSIWLQLWWKGQGVLPKWGDRELSVEMVRDVQANTKENSILFMWWVSLALHMALSVSLLGVLTMYKVEVGVLGKEWVPWSLLSYLTRGWCEFPIPSLTLSL